MSTYLALTFGTLLSSQGTDASFALISQLSGRFVLSCFQLIRSERRALSRLPELVRAAISALRRPPLYRISGPGPDHADSKKNERGLKISKCDGRTTRVPGRSLVDPAARAVQATRSTLGQLGEHVKHDGARSVQIWPRRGILPAHGRYVSSHLMTPQQPSA
ncbi:hypothetical protein C7C46_23910 [Streptomyces tateyamensis]|uniref:Uncharacterized protein n=1 Tax=Streptomyces tateyamensis TaxID=565073 RepID=A0A2V4MXE0_9ACTN|nr:hypothetical protein C7C46_23910 [Streptomyces tateyamensis]